MEIDYSAMAFPKESWKEPKPEKPKWQRYKKPEQKKVKPVKRRKPKKYKKVKSIMQDKSDKRCYLCMLLNNDYRIHSVTEEHHVLFGDIKWISDAYGLRVNLCIEHHRTGEEAVHNNRESAEVLMRLAQQVFTEEYPDLDWMKIVGKNYL